MAKPERREKALAAGAIPDIAAMVGDGMDRRLIEIIRETVADREGVHAQGSRRAPATESERL